MGGVLGPLLGSGGGVLGPLTDVLGNEDGEFFLLEEPLLLTKT